MEHDNIDCDVCDGNGTCVHCEDGSTRNGSICYECQGNTECAECHGLGQVKPPPVDDDLIVLMNFGI